MADDVTLDPIYMRLGEQRTITVRVSDARGEDLTSMTASLALYDSAGAVVLAAAAMTGTGTTIREFSKLVTTGAGKIITAVGTYRAIVKATYGSVVRIWEIEIGVWATP